MKRYIYPILLCALLLAACGDDDNAPSGEPTSIDEATLLAMMPAVTDSLEYASLMSSVCIGDITGYQPAKGEVLYEVTPGVRYIGEETEADARNHFLRLMLPPGYKEEHLTTHTDGSLTYNVLDATLTYTPGGADGALASVELSLPQCTEWKRLVYLSPNDWPDNADYDSPTTPGDVWKHDGKIYLTTVACNYGHHGKMICFDEGGHDYNNYPWILGGLPFSLPKGCASKETWEGMHILLNDQRDHLWRIFDTLSAVEPNSKMIVNLRDMLNHWEYYYLVDNYKVLIIPIILVPTYATTITSYMPRENRFGTTTYWPEPPPTHVLSLSSELDFDKNFKLPSSGWDRVSLNNKPKK